MPGDHHCFHRACATEAWLAGRRSARKCADAVGDLHRARAGGLCGPPPSEQASVRKAGFAELQAVLRGGAVHQHWDVLMPGASSVPAALWFWPQRRPLWQAALRCGVCASPCKRGRVTFRAAWPPAEGPSKAPPELPTRPRGGRGPGVMSPFPLKQQLILRH